MRVKVCGIKREEDVTVCIRAGVDALGFVVEYPVQVPWNIGREAAKRRHGEDTQGKVELGWHKSRLLTQG